MKLSKSIFASFLVIFVLFSCKKEELTPTDPEDGCISCVTSHYAYFKGTVTDSLTGDPITGYNIYMDGPQAATDSLIDGSYLLYALWFEGKYSYAKPFAPRIILIDSANNWVKEMTFDGSQLIENDTIIVDFQVTL